VQLPGPNGSTDEGNGKHCQRGRKAGREMRHLDSLQVWGTNGKEELIPLLGEIQEGFGD
jgi:hypothetical protein